MKSASTLAFLLAAGLTAATVFAQATPFTGVVTGDDVYIRSGPSQSYYDIAQANTGDIIEVVDLMHSWYVIKAPKGTYSYISKQYVDVAGDGKTGTVTGNRVRVRAPSKAGPTIEASYKSQLKLDRGATVEVIGEAGSFYKITPPEGAQAYIHSDYVRQATPGEIEAAQDGQAVDEAVVERAEEAVEPVEAAATDVATEMNAASTATQDTTPAVSAEATTVETATAVTTGTAAQATTPDATAAAGQEPDVSADTTTTRPQITVTTPDPAATDTTPTTAAVSGTDVAPATASPTAGVRQPTITDDTAAVASDNIVTATGTSDQFDGPPIPATVTPETPKTSTTNATTAVAVEQPTATPEPDGRAVDERLAELESRFASASEMKLSDQPIEDLLGDYREIKEAGGLDDQSRVLVDTRIELLEARADLQDTLTELAEVREQSMASKPMMTDYDAVGRLVASTLYTGERLPLLYRLVDPLNGLTVGYVEPTDEVNLTPLLGRVVGVEGSTRFHPGLKLKVITVTNADALTAAQ